MSASPIACDLAALTADQRQQHATLAAQLAQMVEVVEELPDGYAFRYTGDESTWLMVTSWIDFERRCCPFLRFTLERAGNESVWLRVTGSEGVKAFLAAQLPVT